MFLETFLGESGLEMSDDVVEVLLRVEVVTAKLLRRAFIAARSASVAIATAIMPKALLLKINKKITQEAVFGPHP